MRKSPKPTPISITKTYIAPTPAASYEPPKLPAYKERTSIGALYTPTQSNPPSQEYIPPKSSKPHTSYDLPKEKEAPIKNYLSPKAKEPKELYDLPKLPEYPHTQPQKSDNQLYTAPKLPTGYLPPSILYTPPQSKAYHKEPSADYEPPKSLYSPPSKASLPTINPTYHKSEPYDTPTVHHLQHHGYASLLGPADSYSKPEGPKKIYAEVYHLTPEGSYGPVDKSLIKELPPPEFKYESSNVPHQDIYKPPKNHVIHGGHPSPHGALPSGSVKATYHRKGVKTPVGYEYPTPAGYSPDNNPTFPQPTQIYALPKHHGEGYKPPPSNHYRDASKRPTISSTYTSHLPHIHDPTFPSDVEEYSGLGLSYAYTPAPEARSANKAKKHSFNIIIKSESEPELSAGYKPSEEVDKNQVPRFGSLLAAQEPTSAVKLAKNVGSKVRILSLSCS